LDDEAKSGQYWFRREDQGPENDFISPNAITRQVTAYSTFFPQDKN